MSDALTIEVRKSLFNQMEAALRTLAHCVERCPETSWNAPVANLKFCQVVFHTLFFTDYYLGRGEDGFREQAFHQDHRLVFRDYEELQPREQVLLYERPFILRYMEHCRAKAAEAIASETADTLAGPCGFPRRNLSRMERHIYNTRHVQHHAAQLSLRLRLDHAADVPWVGSGWGA